MLARTPSLRIVLVLAAMLVSCAETVAIVRPHAPVGLTSPAKQREPFVLPGPSAAGHARVCTVQEKQFGAVTAMTQLPNRYSLACRLGPSPSHELERTVHEFMPLRRCLDGLRHPVAMHMRVDVGGDGLIATVLIIDGNDESPDALACANWLVRLRTLALGCRFSHYVTLTRFGE